MTLQVLAEPFKSRGTLWNSQICSGNGGRQSLEEERSHRVQAAWVRIPPFLLLLQNFFNQMREIVERVA